MKPSTKPLRTPEQLAEETAIRRRHSENPILARPSNTIGKNEFEATLRLVARFKELREAHGKSLAEVADKMGIDPPALSRLETGKMLNPTLATLHKWAQALGQRLEMELTAL